MKDKMTQEIDQMKTRELTPYLADHLLIEAVRKNAIPASKLPKVMETWDNSIVDPESPTFIAQRTAWSLFNAFTNVSKSRSPADQIDGTLRLTDVFRTALALSAGS
jgi:hypothetical protein